MRGALGNRRPYRDRSSGMFYRRGSQEKTHPPCLPQGQSFSCFQPHVIKARCVLADLTIHSNAEHGGPAILVSLPAVFIASRDEASPL